MPPPVPVPVRQIPDSDFYPTPQLVKADGRGWGACAMVVAETQTKFVGVRMQLCRSSAVCCTPFQATWQLDTTYEICYYPISSATLQHGPRLARTQL